MTDHRPTEVETDVQRRLATSDDSRPDHVQGRYIDHSPTCLLGSTASLQFVSHEHGKGRR
jgi:hypothetical protein